MINVLQIFKRYRGNYPLLNEIVNNNPKKIKTTVCYISGKPDGNNHVEDIVHKVVYLKVNEKLGYFNFKIINLLREIIKREKIDIINCHLDKTVPFGVISSFLTRRSPKVVATIHGLVGKNYLPFNKKIKNLFFYHKLDKIIAVSNSIREDIIKENLFLEEDKVVAIQNGIDYSDYLFEENLQVARKKILPTCNKNFWFGTVGRLVPKKNHTKLILAFAEVLKKKDDCALLIVGGGPLEKDLKELAHSLKLENSVFFMGPRKDVPLILKTLNTFVFPTFREGLPLAMLEAMGSGLPIIASDIGCIKEVVEGFQVGRLIDPDDVVETANAMIGFLNMSDDDLKRLGNSARERALNGFTGSKMAGQYEKLFDELCRT